MAVNVLKTVVINAVAFNKLGDKLLQVVPNCGALGFRKLMVSFEQAVHTTNAVACLS